MLLISQLLDIASGQVRILKLIGCMLLLSHWNGCVQFLVPYLQGFPQNSWVVTNRLEVRKWLDNPFSPHNLKESVFVLCCLAINHLRCKRQLYTLRLAIRWYCEPLE